MPIYFSVGRVPPYLEADISCKEGSASSAQQLKASFAVNKPTEPDLNEAKHNLARYLSVSVSDY